MQNRLLSKSVDQLKKPTYAIKIQELIEGKKILTYPVQFIRGKTIDDVLIVEEAQNLTKAQMLAILTRIGKTGKIIINGDLEQTDIRDNGMNGLAYAIELSKRISDIQYIKLKENHRSDLVGKILDYLEKSGLAENTMVIYASDHGEYCGDHGLLLKGPAHFRGLINMPLLWKVPGLTKTSVSDSLVSTVDVPKTILSLLGMKEKQHPEIFHTGYDIKPILEDPNNKLREQLLIEHDDELKRNESFRLRTLITETHRLTIYDGFENCGDIFNYKDDPGEVNNLWDKDSELKFDLTNKLMREIISLQPRLPTRKAQH